jgi:trehalose-6-phosphatase
MCTAMLCIIDDTKTNIVQAVSSVPGAEVEDNIYSISVHYRNCPRSELDKIKDVVTHVQVCILTLLISHSLRLCAQL